MDRELIQKGLDLFERWVAAYERRLEFEEKRDERIAADQAMKLQIVEHREERLQAAAEARSAAPAKTISGRWAKRRAG